ncbi:hypothetical protein D3C78_1442060 [compost metagenome]
MPAVEGFVEPGADVLHFHRQTTIGLGGAHQLLQGLLAQLHLVLQHAQVFAQHRIRVVLLHLVEQHAHGRQRRAQFMGSARRLGRHGQ